MKKASTVSALAFCAAAAMASCPEISGVETASMANRDVVVSYGLSGGAAFVTAELLTNGVPVDVAMAAVSGDIGKVVEPGSRSFVWKARRDWPEHFGEMVSVRVKATPRGRMDYLVIDLKNSNTLSWYATSNDVPGGVADMVYKTDKLLMRRIPAAGVAWRMGQPAGGELCEGSAGSASYGEAALRDNETGHKVVLTEDFYIGVYEFTQRQYFNVTGQHPSRDKSGSAADRYEATKARPVEQVSANTLRGTISGTFAGWPQAMHGVADGSVLRTLRDFTGVESLDLPTEAQWEFACRAGTTTSLNSGKNVSDPRTGSSDANLAEVGWSQYNGSLDERAGKHSNDVGLLLPNAFGLYDMHGNVEELCLDWASRGDDYRATFAAGWERGAATIDPVGPETGTGRIVRGGDWFYASCWMRSAARAIRESAPDATSYHTGFRLVCAVSAE